MKPPVVWKQRGFCRLGNQLMNDLDEKAINTSFKIIGLDQLDIGQRSYVIITDTFLKRFRQHGYIRSLDHIVKYKEDFKVQAEYLISLAD